MEALYAYCGHVARNLDAFGFDQKRLALEALRVRVSGNGRRGTLSGTLPTMSGAASEADGQWRSDYSIKTLCEPLAATSRARLTCSCPRTSDCEW